MLLTQTDRALESWKKFPYDNQIA